MNADSDDRVARWFRGIGKVSPPRDEIHAYSQQKSAEALVKWHALGICSVEVLGSGQGDDCPVCRALSGKTFLIEQAPVVPPENCCCRPYCRSILAAE